MVSLVRCLNVIYTTDVCLKVGPTTFLLVSFSSLKESTCITLRKIFCISLQILFLFSRKSNLIILHIQISLPRQMPKKYNLLNNLSKVHYVNEIWPVYALLQKTIIKKFYKICNLKTFCVLKELRTTPPGK